MIDQEIDKIFWFDSIRDQNKYRAWKTENGVLLEKFDKDDKIGEILLDKYIIKALGFHITETELRDDDTRY